MVYVFQFDENGNLKFESEQQRAWVLKELYDSKEEEDDENGLDNGSDDYLHFPNSDLPSLS